MTSRTALLVTLLLLAALLPLGGCSATASDRAVEGGPVLRVASDLANPPFIDVDASGAAVGRDVTMMEELGAALGRRVEWVELPFRELIPALQDGRADVICSTFGVTPERAAKVAYTRPYFATAIAIVCRAGADEPHTKADLASRRVGAAPATTAERAVRRHLPRAVLVLETKDAPADELLLAGELDAAVMDGPAADALVAESGGRLARLTENLGAELYALAVPFGKSDLVAELDDALAAMERAGRLAELDTRFGVRSAPR